MIISRTHATQLNNTIAKADALKTKIDSLATKVAKLDGVCGLDKDGDVDSISIRDSIPEASAFRRFFSSQSPITADVQLNSESSKPESAEIETSRGFLSRARYELSTDDNGTRTYSSTELHPIGEELLESYTFGPNDTITVNT